MNKPLRILCLQPFPPRRDSQHGGGRVMAQFLEGLMERHRVAVVYLQAAGEAPPEAFFMRRCEHLIAVLRLWTGPRLHHRALRFGRLLTGLVGGRPMWATDGNNPDFAQTVTRLAAEWQPDLIQAENHWMAQHVLPGVTSPAPLVVTVHEPGLGSAPFLKALPAGLTRVLHRVDQAAWRRFEPAMLGRADALVVFTPQDERLYRQQGLRLPIERIPFGVPIPPEPLDPAGAPAPQVLFVGSFIHPPNREAALHLAQVIFPQVLSQVPAARLVIVGPEPPAELATTPGTGVTVTGAVPDLTPYLQAAAVLVAPIYSGGGMRVKVLEGLAAGKALVVTPLALAGLDVCPGEQVWLAQTDAELVQGVVALLNDPDRRVRMGRAARAYAEQHLGWPAALDAYDRLYRRALAERRRR